MTVVLIVDLSELTEFGFPNKKKNFLFSLSVAYSVFNLELFLFTSFIRLLKLYRKQIRGCCSFCLFVAFICDEEQLAEVISEEELMLAIDRIRDYVTNNYHEMEEEREDDVQEEVKESKDTKKEKKKKKKQPVENEPLFSDSFVHSFETLLNTYVQVRID